MLSVSLLSSAGTVAAVKYINLPWTNNIYNVSSPDDQSRAAVSVFDDGDNTCYVVTKNFVNTGYPSISCVKR
jgi:hypothetical protein